MHTCISDGKISDESDEVGGACGDKGCEVKGCGVIRLPINDTYEHQKN